jgi:hypothetical protein
MSTNLRADAATVTMPDGTSEMPDGHDDYLGRAAGHLMRIYVECHRRGLDDVARHVDNALDALDVRMTRHDRDDARRRVNG